MKRRGFTLWELLAACILLGMLVTVSLQFFRGTVAGRRAAYERLTAIQEAENLMERWTTRPWNELTPQAARDVRLSPQAASTLTDGQAEVRIDDATGTPPAKRIIVLIRWQSRDGNACAPVRLVAWKTDH